MLSLFLIKMHIRVLGKGDIGMGLQGHVLYILDVTMYMPQMNVTLQPHSPTLHFYPERIFCAHWFASIHYLGMKKGLSTREAGRGHATPHMPVETAKCWWLLKIEHSLSLKPAQTPLINGPKPVS